MRGADRVLLAFHNIKCEGAKAILCMLAVVVGVFSVCISYSAGEAAKATVENELSEIGICGSVLYAEQSGKYIDTEVADVVRSMNGVKSAMALSVNTACVRLRKTQSTAVVIGVDPYIVDTWNVKVLFGRSFRRADMENGEDVALVDGGFAIAAYGRENIVGKTVYITVDGSLRAFEIIGVVKSQKKGMQALIGGSVPELVYVPFSVFGSTDKLALAVADGISREKVNARAADSLSRITGTDFLYKDLNIYAESFSRITKTVALLATGMGMVALLVGGIGVMGCMISAAERRRHEIGIMISLGATKSAVMSLYLLEAVLICLIGGMIGWAGSEALLWAAQRIYGITAGASAENALMGIGSSCLCGAVFGLLPAIRAANMAPIEAIKG